MAQIAGAKAKSPLFGNDLLIEVFGGGDFRDTYDEFRPPFQPEDSKERKRSLGKTKFPKFPSTLDSIDVESTHVSGIIETAGIDAIAWYLPFRVYGETNWGIYFDSFAMSRFAMEVATKCRKLNSAITNSVVQQVLYASVLRHELEHAIQELALATQIKAGTISTGQIRSASFSRPGSYRETIASHLEHFDPLVGVSGMSVRDINIVRHVLREFPSQGPYGQWRNETLDSLDYRYEFDLGRTHDLGELSSELRREIGGRSSSKFIEIPVYLWAGNSLRLPLSGLDLRAQSLDCKKLLRFMNKGGLTKNFGEELYVLRSPDHDLKIKNPHTRPINFACHDWDTVPDKVVGEIAAAAGISRKDFVERIRRLI